MPIPTGGLAEITLEATIFGQSIANVFFYWDSTNAAITNMLGIAGEFNTGIVTPLALVQSVAVIYDNVKVRDVFGINPDVNVAPAQADGDLVGDVLPRFNALRIDLNPTTKETRRGYKRFAGLREADQTNGVLVAAALTDWNTFAGNLDNDLIVGASTYNAVIRGIGIPTDTTRNVVNPIISVVVRDFITSQISRLR